MIGLAKGFENLPKKQIVVTTGSSSGPVRTDCLMGIPLLDALGYEVGDALRVRSADGAGLMLSRGDCQQAYLVEQKTGGWQLVLAQDATRRRWLHDVIQVE